MHTRVVAVMTTVILGTVALLLPVHSARAGIALRPAVVAHRGASAVAPENTLEAVDRAKSLGTLWVENDVQRTRDGELVVVHDDSLRRTTDVEEVFPGRAPWKVKDFTAAEVARLDAGSWFGPAYAGVRVPTLTQYLDRVDRNHQNLLLEIKNPELYPGIEQEVLGLLGDEVWLDEHHLASRLVVQSFSADCLRTVHRLMPAVRIGLLGKPALSDLPRISVFADQINPSCTGLSQAYVAAVQELTGPHGRPMKVFTWTVDDAETARAVAGYGVDGVITDRPDVVRRALYWF
ncbi:glycerophosphodiester phosphodiesterase family protein [Streptomyces sp. ID05-04B]|uniref:glycerophosphodiester phosphodiesterase n=1 Tax=unclassified Streptomyces TaxID=2593676 RepID=UPI000D19C10F|nr:MULTISPECIES: glycerophosphodiester phosphodiesterase family protein [unclassified Streptomyces]AVV43256.1 glycerophosphodiester phosphodiesterase [Streptomyces sp. P3]MDX5564435.1 glycerophosphodiester phosphodiesterase family protein [Streptomyces sp. ID05-04B]